MSFHSLYSARTRAGAVMLMLSGVAFVADDWFATTSLTVILILLLVAGTVIFFFGLRDLIRDIRHMLHERSQKSGHA